jgi:hypothetical protein
MGRLSESHAECVETEDRREGGCLVGTIAMENIRSTNPGRVVRYRMAREVVGERMLAQEMPAFASSGWIGVVT